MWLVEQLSGQSLLAARRMVNWSGLAPCHHVLASHWNSIPARGRDHLSSIAFVGLDRRIDWEADPCQAVAVLGSSRGEGREDMKCSWPDRVTR